jgi:hypothetical protein
LHKGYDGLAGDGEIVALHRLPEFVGTWVTELIRKFLERFHLCLRPHLGSSTKTISQPW